MDNERTICIPVTVSFKIEPCYTGKLTVGACGRANNVKVMGELQLATTYAFATRQTVMLVSAQGEEEVADTDPLLKLTATMFKIFPCSDVAIRPELDVFPLKSGV